MTLSVINAGFGRTGTMSIKMALEKLGVGPCHHMETVFNDPLQLPFWQKATNGEYINWDDVFNGYKSAVDWPSAHYWKELAEFYPDSKVLLSIRSPERWWESYSSTIKQLLERMDEIPEEYPRLVLEMANKIITEQTFEGVTSNKEHVLAAFEKRINDVKRVIPVHRLLLFDVTEGWPPLCEFLGVPIPESVFPHSNTKIEFWDIFGAGM
jgi:Sulfotransferase domain